MHNIVSNVVQNFITVCKRKSADISYVYFPKLDMLRNKVLVKKLVAYAVDYVIIS